MDNKTIKFLPNEIRYESSCESTVRNEDLFRATIAEEFDKRWDSKISTSESEKKCKSCIYFRGIAGDYEFWDYGICCNEKSTNDGRLIKVHLSCDFYEKISDKSV